MKSPALSKEKWMAAGAVIFVLLACPLVFSAEPADPDIWTEDTEPMRGDPWSGRRIEGFLKRIEEENPQRAAELRKLREEDPAKFEQVMREEIRKFFRPPDRPGPQEPAPRPRGPEPMGPEGGRGGRWQDHLQRRVDEFMKWLEDNNPELANELGQLKEKDPAAYIGRVMEARRKYDPILRAEKDNPELAIVLKEDLVLQKQRDELLQELRGAEGEKRIQLLKELKALVAQRFDLIIRKKTLQYQELEKRLKRLQEELEKRQTEVNKLKNSKEQAVEEHVKELTAQAEKINWD